MLAIEQNYQIVKDPNTGKYKIDLGNNHALEIKLPNNLFSSKPIYLLDGEEIAVSKLSANPTVITLPGQDPLTIVQLGRWNSYWDLFPKLNINSQNVTVYKTVSKFEKIMVLLPWLLVVRGGLIGGVFGAIAYCLNTTVLRSEKSMFLKVLLYVTSAVFAFIGYLIVASVMLAAIHHRH